MSRSALATSSRPVAGCSAARLRWAGGGCCCQWCWLGWTGRRWRKVGREAVMLLKLWIFWAVWAVLPGRRCVAGPAPASGAQRGALVWLAGLVVVAYSGLLEPRLLIVREHRVHWPAPAGMPPLPGAGGGCACRLVRPRLAAGSARGSAQCAGCGCCGSGRRLGVRPTARSASAAGAVRTLAPPVWGVLGNHDTEAPGPPVAAALRQPCRAMACRCWMGSACVFRAGGGWLSTCGGDARGDVARCSLRVRPGPGWCWPISQTPPRCCPWQRQSGTQRPHTRGANHAAVGHAPVGAAGLECKGLV
jgi:hypothetical protein